MNIDNNYNSEKNRNEREEQAWEESGPGKLFLQLKKTGLENARNVEISGKWDTHKTYRFGPEEADLIVHLHNGGVGERGGQLVSFIESYQYKMLNWWKKAIEETEGLQVALLDTPLIVALREAGIPEDKKWTLNAEKVAEMYAPEEEKEKAMRVILQIIIRTINSVVAPDFEVRTYDGAPRLVPLTEEAKKSRTENNETYKNTVQKLKQVPELLEKEYKNLKF